MQSDAKVLQHQFFLLLQVVNAGPSSKLGVDNTTGCLPDVLQFCSPVATGQNTDLTCPLLAFRRPAAAVANGTTRVGSRLVHLDAGGEGGGSTCMWDPPPNIQVHPPSTHRWTPLHSWTGLEGGGGGREGCTCMWGGGGGGAQGCM